MTFRRFSMTLSCPLMCKWGRLWVPKQPPFESQRCSGYSSTGHSNFFSIMHCLFPNRSEQKRFNSCQCCSCVHIHKKLYPIDIGQPGKSCKPPKIARPRFPLYEKSKLKLTGAKNHISHIHSKIKQARYLINMPGRRQWPFVPERCCGWRASF